MNETEMSGDDYCECGHQREYHSGGYGDCQNPECSCHGFENEGEDTK